VVKRLSGFSVTPSDSNLILHAWQASTTGRCSTPKKFSMHLHASIPAPPPLSALDTLPAGLYEFAGQGAHCVQRPHLLSALESMYICWPTKRVSPPAASAQYHRIPTSNVKVLCCWNAVATDLCKNPLSDENATSVSACGQLGGMHTAMMDAAWVLPLRTVYTREW
jgi:hypothetical protein